MLFYVDLAEILGRKERGADRSRIRFAQPVDLMSAAPRQTLLRSTSLVAPVHPATQYCRFLQELGHEVLVANPRKLRAIYASNRKSDQNDARMIARVARVDPKLLYPIKHGTAVREKVSAQPQCLQSLGAGEGVMADEVGVAHFPAAAGVAFAVKMEVGLAVLEERQPIGRRGFVLPHVT